MNTASVLPTAPAQYYANCDAAAQSLVAGLRTRLHRRWHYSSAFLFIRSVVNKQ
jgi:hypothetical protein